MSNKFIGANDTCKTVREALEVMLGLNDADNNTITKDIPANATEEEAAKIPWRKMTVEELAQNNYELAANIADLLGMSDLYLPDKRELANQ